MRKYSSYGARALSSYVNYFIIFLVYLDGDDDVNNYYKGVYSAIGDSYNVYLLLSTIIR